MVSHRPLFSARKHSKTFTGCWTCRARKVKCDERRPRCRQCHQKNLPCEGYDIRLQWMTPETGSEDGTSGDRPFPGAQPKAYRSRIVQAPALPILPFQEIDDILLRIDSLRPETLAPREQHSPGSRLLKCFGVFDSTSHRSPSTSRRGSPIPVLSSTEQPPSSGTTPITSEPEIQQSVDLLNWDQHLTAGDAAIPSTSLSAWDDPFFYDPSADNGSHEDVLHLQPLAPQLHDWPLTVQKQQGIPNHFVPRTPDADDNLPSQEKFLMHHYATRVVNLFCALDNPKSPWKTIHLPRAQQITGELAISGSTSQIRHSLRNALLSISAFCLSNEYKTQSYTAEAQKWYRAGVYYRGVAVKYLKEAVGSGLSKESGLKYKECLATMLSMISINVMSGDTETCGVHLDGAFQLIRQARSWKTKYSNKAYSLHRVYFYLRTIYQSTLLGSQGVTGAVAGACHSSASGASPVSDVSDFIETEDAPATGSAAPLHASTNLSTYAHIYGVPQGLLVLLNRTVDVVNQVVQERERVQTRALPLHLAPRCSELEKNIMDWSMDPKDSDTSSLSCNKTANSDIVRHMTHAFHNAVIIYFAQHIHLLAHHYLQPFIRKVIESIEEIEKIKAETKILASPLYWPAFIAASEAFDPELQKRIQDWYKQVEVYGIESVRTGIGVLQDVWEQGPCQGLTTTSIWRMVVQRTGATLILS